MHSNHLNWNSNGPLVGGCRFSHGFATVLSCSINHNYTSSIVSLFLSARRAHTSEHGPYDWFLLPWLPWFVCNEESVESLRNCIPLWCADGLASNGNWSPGRLAGGCNLPRHSVARLQWVENRHNLSDPEPYDNFVGKITYIINYNHIYIYTHMF